MLNDPTLIEAARHGDEVALIQLLKISQPDLKRMAASQCASKADADDAVQEPCWWCTAASAHCVR
jgi:RNA polymerase sigma-70 factor (ECF subfamily)